MKAISIISESCRRGTKVPGGPRGERFQLQRQPVQAWLLQAGTALAVL